MPFVHWIAFDNNCAHFVASSRGEYVIVDYCLFFERLHCILLLFHCLIYDWFIFPLRRYGDISHESEWYNSRIELQIQIVIVDVRRLRVFNEFKIIVLNVWTFTKVFLSNICTFHVVVHYTHMTRTKFLISLDLVRCVERNEWKF